MDICRYSNIYFHERGIFFVADETVKHVLFSAASLLSRLCLFVSQNVPVNMSNYGQLTGYLFVVSRIPSTLTTHDYFLTTIVIAL